VLAWLSIGVLTLTRPGEAVAARLLCRFRPPSSEVTGRVASVVDGVLRRCRLTPGSVNLYVITDRQRNAYATGRHSLALTTGIVEDHRRGAITDASLACVISHEIGHLALRHVRLAPMLAWFAMPWRVTYRLGAKVIMPIAARQPRALLAVVVVATFSVAIASGVQQHQWASVSVLAGLAASTLAAPTINAVASRASEYAADQFAAQAGYGDELDYALTAMDRKGGTRSVRSRVVSRHPRTEHRVLRLTQANESLDAGQSPFVIPTSGVCVDPFAVPCGDGCQVGRCADLPVRPLSAAGPASVNGSTWAVR
jgi:Zn-dependent protease with chaperone function